MIYVVVKTVIFVVLTFCVNHDNKKGKRRGGYFYVLKLISFDIYCFLKNILLICTNETFYQLVSITINHLCIKIISMLRVSNFSVLMFPSTFLK